MANSTKHTLRRRELLQASLFAFVSSMIPGPIVYPDSDSETKQLRGGRKLGVVPFTGEFPVPMGTPFGTGLDGRMYSDLSQLVPEKPITPRGEFYIRTRASELLDTRDPWYLRVNGLVERPLVLSHSELLRMAEPMGVHLMECAGNERRIHFGLMSVASWAGVRLSDIFKEAKIKPGAGSALVSGFDKYSHPSVSSMPGASWVFPLEELNSAGAFLATSMNGAPLTSDQGAPLRLLVPGWYGCACIKWVNRIVLVDNEQPATSQMQEYASRTLQDGTPQLAKDYKAAVIEQAATPIRIEKWLVAGRVNYRVVGILWGGSRLINALQIRFNPDEPYAPVDSFHQTNNDPWSFWSHIWEPKTAGGYVIHLQVDQPPMVARRLDAGYYDRSTYISEV